MNSCNLKNLIKFMNNKLNALHVYIYICYNTLIHYNVYTTLVHTFPEVLNRKIHCDKCTSEPVVKQMNKYFMMNLF